MNKAEAVENRIDVYTTQDLRQTFYEIGNGKFLNAYLKFVFPKTPVTAKKIDKAFGLNLYNSNFDFKELLEINQVIKNAQFFKTKDVDLHWQPMVRTSDLWQHQLNAYRFARDLPSAMLWMGVGTGKSKTSIDIMQNSNAKRILLICPPYIHRDEETWQKQFCQYIKSDYVFLPLRKGTTAKKAEEAKKFLTQNKDKIAILGINYESLWRPDFAKFILSQKFDLLIADESHKLKSHNSSVSEFVYKASGNFEQKLFLTGTVMYSSQLDVYGQYRALDSGIFGTSFSRFRDYFADIYNHNGIPIIRGYRNQEELVERIAPITFQVDESVLNLPEPIHDIRTFELSKEERKIYDEMESSAAIDLGTQGYSISTHVLTKMLRLRQITGGSLPLQDWETDETRAVRIGDSKKQLLINILEDLPPNEPIVIFARFIMDLAMVKEAALAVGRTYGEISGRAYDKNEWNKGTIQVLGVNDSAGEGMDFTKANYGMFFSYDYSIGKFTQCVGRIRRPPNYRFAYFYHLTAKDTIDEAMYASIQKGGNLLHSAVDYLRSLSGAKRNASKTNKPKRDG